MHGPGWELSSRASRDVIYKDYKLEDLDTWVVFQQLITRSRVGYSGLKGPAPYVRQLLEISL
jgi:hypothetical protein